MGYVANWVGDISADYNTAGNWDVGLVPIGSKGVPYQYQPLPALPEECKALIDNWTGPVGLPADPGYVAGFLHDPTSWPVINSAVPEIRELKIAHPEAGAPVLGYYGQLTVVAGADFYCDGDLEIGAGGEGILYMEGGLITVGDDFRINSGTLDMSGGTIIAGSPEGMQLDRQDNGVVLLSGGMIDATEIEWNGTSTITFSGTGVIKLNGFQIGMFNARVLSGQLIDGGGGSTPLMAWYDTVGDHTYIGVPEPMTLALLGLGGLLIRRRRS